MKETSKSKSLLLGALGMLMFAAAWEVIGSYRLAGLSWPPLSTVVAYLTDPTHTSLFLRALGATLSAVAIGYAIGCSAGLLLAVLSHIASVLRPGADRAMAVVHAIPSIALGPLFIVLLSREVTPIAIASLNVLFAVYVAASSGLASASPAHTDVMRVLGASVTRQLCHLDLPAALPAIVTGMKLAVPTALIGAIIGEWFGAPRGLGLLIVNAMQNFQIPLLWSAVLLTALVSLTVFAALTLLEHFAYERFG
jgi:ABC-type nitrate/sulfonate/bicarbonate transport system permease component